MSQSAFDIVELPTEKAVVAIRTGLPVKALDGLSKTLGLTTDLLAKKLGISPRTLRDQRKKLAPLSPENTEKVVRIAQIYRLARNLFTTDQAVAQWLATPAPALNGLEPLDLLDTGIGAQKVEAILQGIAYGNVM